MSTDLTGIEHPGLHDVLWGRGGHTTCHPGNVRYRNLTQNYRDAFKSAGKIRRLEIANEIVQKWRGQNPPGRFLVMSEPEKGNDSLWHDVGDTGAVQKVMGSLRQRKPKSAGTVLQQSIKQNSSNTLEGNGDSQMSLESFSDWQQTFVNTTPPSNTPGHSSAPAVLNNAVWTSTPSFNQSQPGTVHFPSLNQVERPQNAPVANLINEDVKLRQKDLTTSMAQNPTPLMPNHLGNEEVPLAAALTHNIFDEDAQVAVPLLSPVVGGNSKHVWDFADFSLLSPGGISSQDMALLYQDFRDPLPL